MLVKKKQDTYVYQEDNQYFITLSDKTWDRIIYKVNNIKIKKHFDLSSYIIGASPWCWVRRNAQISLTSWLL